MNSESEQRVADWILKACLADVMSVKPGNVAPGREFSDATVDDFVRSAEVSAPLLACHAAEGVGRAVYLAAAATRQAVGHNTNLGILLLVAPLAAVPLSISLQDGIETVLRGLTVEDADWAYRAIRLAEPGGLGESSAQDISETPTETLRQCMAHATDHDLIARQYTNGFQGVLQDGLTWRRQSVATQPEEHQIGWVALRLMSEFGDTLVARKCGTATSEEVRMRAQFVLERGWPETEAGVAAWTAFDVWLRDAEHRRNPGTTADMIAAIEFAHLREYED